MYEMEGPRPAHAALVAGCPAAVRHEAATGRVPRRRVAGLPSLAASRSRLRSEHVFSGEAVLPPRLAGAQGLWPGPAEKLRSSTGHLPFIPCPSPLSTGPSTSPSTAARSTGAPQPQQRPRRSEPAILTGDRHSGGAADREGRSEVDTGRENIRAAASARNRGQARLRAVTAAIGAASVLAGGGIAVGLASASSAQPAASTATSHGTGQQSGTSGDSGSGGSASGSSGSSSGSGGLKSAAAPSSSSGSGQVTSGGS
jgi:uncharacterized membrane protein YgcG